MNTDDLIKINLENARAVSCGNYSGLLCPKCGEKFVEGFFSERILKNGYGIWFECQSCGNVEHIGCTTQPGGFTPLRVSDKFQKLDEQSWREEQ